MSNENKHLTLKEAAQLSNTSRDTIWRAIKNQKLKATQDLAVGGTRFLIKEAELQKWLQDRLGDVSDSCRIHRTDSSDTSRTVQTDTPDSSDTFRTVQTDTSDSSDTFRTVQTDTSDSPDTQSDALKGVPLQAHLEALKTVQEAIHSANTFFEKARTAEQLASRYQRQIEALRYELTLHQRTLTEQAESLAQERCLKIQAEESTARLTELEQIEREYQELKATNEERQKQWEQERAQLLDNLKTSEHRVSWIEQRVPRWVRSIFRAG